MIRIATCEPGQLVRADALAWGRAKSNRSSVASSRRSIGRRRLLRQARKQYRMASQYPFQRLRGVMRLPQLAQYFSTCTRFVCRDIELHSVAALRFCALSRHQQRTRRPPRVTKAAGPARVV